VRSEAPPRLVRLGRAAFSLGGIESFAEFLAGLEAGIALGLYRDGLPSPRITALPLLLLLYDEATKSAQIDTLVCLECLGNGLENGLKYCFDLRLFATGLRRHCVDQLWFGHLFFSVPVISLVCALAYEVTAQEPQKLFGRLVAKP